MDIKFEIKGKTLDPEVQEAVDRLASSSYYWQHQAEKFEAENKELRKQVESLEDDGWMITCLEACGVDNWSGYETAMEMYNNAEIFS